MKPKITKKTTRFQLPISPEEKLAQKDFSHTKKHQKAQKAQKCNQAKTQNANKRTKIKNALKNLFAYLRFCVFCAREVKKMKSLYIVMY